MTPLPICFDTFQPADYPYHFRKCEAALCSHYPEHIGYYHLYFHRRLMIKAALFIRLVMNLISDRIKTCCLADILGK